MRLQAIHVVDIFEYPHKQMHLLLPLSRDFDAAAFV